MRHGADTPPRRARSTAAHTVVEAAAVAAIVAWLAWRADTTPPSTLWLDDAWLALVTKAEGVGEIVRVGVTAPGFAVVLRLVHGATGAVEALVHVALVAALLAPVAAHLVARRALRLSPAAALTAAIVVASAPVLVTYAGRVKPYTADVALSAIVLGAAAMADRRSRWWAFVAVSVVAVVVSATTAVTVVGAGLVAALRSPRAAWPPLLAGAAAGGAWWLLVLDDADNEGLRDFWRDHHTLERAPDAAAALVPLPGDAALVVLGLAAAAALVLRPRVALLAVAPIAVAVALGVAGAIPLGGGRTDAHLLPAVAVLVAAVVDAVPLRLLAAAAVAVIALLRASDPEPYPAEDVGPLVAAVEAAATEDQRIVVYSSARWAYALETAAPVDLLDSDREANGFEVAVDDDRVAILPRLRDEPERYPDAIDAAVGDASTVWLVVSHPGPDVADLEAALAAAGFTASERDARPGAELSRWERATR